MSFSFVCFFIFLLIFHSYTQLYPFIAAIAISIICYIFTPSTKPNNHKKLSIKDIPLTSPSSPTLFSIYPSPTDRLHALFELFATLVLFSLSIFSYFFREIRDDWSSLTTGPDTNLYFYGGGYWALVAVICFWFYCFLLVLYRLFNKAALWSYSTSLYSLALLSYACAFRSAYLYPRSATFQIFIFIQSFLVLALFTNNIFSRFGDSNPVLLLSSSLSPATEPIASLASLLSYSWINPLIWKGYFHSLTQADIWNLAVDDLASSSLAAFKKLNSSSSLAIKLLKFFARPLIISNLWTFLYSILNFGPPFLLKSILDYVDNPKRTPASLIWLYVVAFLVCGVLTNVVQGRSLFIGRRISIRLRSILIGEIYAKTLRRKVGVGKGEEKTDTEGEDNQGEGEDEDEDENGEPTTHGAIINLMAVDTFKVSEIAAYLHFITLAVFVSALSILFLYILIGWSAFVGAASMFLLMPIQYQLSKIYSLYQNKLMAATDRRINKINEILQSIRIIKFFAWEEQFSKDVLQIRDTELSLLRKQFICWTFATLVYFMVPIAVTVATFSSYIFLQKKLLTAPIAFTVIALLNVMRGPLDQIAEMITEFLQAKVSLNRIQKFLAEPETFKYSQVSNDSTISFKNASFSWNSSSKPDFKLLDIDISFDLGKLNLIVGPTGSGKSSLLLALLGEMQLTAGSVSLPSPKYRDQVSPDPSTNLAESVAYCSQTPWLLNDTLRNNILFGSEFDLNRYNAVIDACSLARDLEILDAGDQTEIGEKGITLSGGQKQRVSLARAFYSNSRHLLLDDCLSAVDSHTAKWIYNNCLTGLLAQNRTIILVSHNISLTVTQASKVIVMDNGRVKAQGPPNTLLSQGHLGDDDLTSASVTRAQSLVNLSVQNSNPGLIPNPHEPTLIAGEQVDSKINREPDPEISQEELRGDGKLVSEETKAHGRVATNVYISYMKAIGGPKFWTLLVILFLAQPVFDIGLSYWIKVWTAAIVKGTALRTVALEKPVVLYSHFFYSLLNHFKSSSGSVADTLNAWDKDTEDSAYYMVMYILIGLAFSTITALDTLFNYFGGLNASRALFAKLLASVMQTKLRFFDSTPLGRIMNRFSKDMEAVDQDLSGMTSHVVNCFFGAVSITVLVVAITPSFLFFAILIVIAYYFIGSFYLSASREIKRLDSISKSPIYQHFGETLSGVSTIRAYGVSDRFVRDNLEKVDNNNRPYFYLWVANRWLSFRVDLTGAFVSFFAAAMIILSSSRLDAGSAGLSLSYALTFNEYVLWMVRLYSVVEMNMNSVERLLEYMDLDKEAPAIIPDSRPPAGWPSRGEIEVNDLSLRYAPDLPLVIRNVSFSVPSFNKIGIVGRTGAGKSTIITAFFRFLEADTGNIVIDGVDISKIGLKDLRENLAIIPQDPTLFQGTVRSNLDPFGEYNDQDIFKALRRVHLIKDEDTGSGNVSGTVSEGDTPKTENINVFHDLSTPISESGSNLSQGQRQLVCLARSLLKSPKLLLLDEATASIDYKSDAQIQKTIREEFSQTTILTIAHRLRSIADYDRILVLDAGQVAEYGTPLELLKSESVFYSMCKDSGELDVIVDIAKDTHTKANSL